MAQAMPAICPVCRKRADLARLPFCSTRCANIDLGRWLGEKYRVETNEPPEAALNLDEGTDIE